jgi:predicted transcriptional regulator
MNLREFFERLEKEFGLTPYDYCKIKPISYSTLKKYLKGTRPTRNVAKTIERITDKRVTLKEMGFDDE